MIKKSFEIDKIKLENYNLYLFYGENEGYKNEIISDKFIKKYKNQINQNPILIKMLKFGMDRLN